MTGNSYTRSLWHLCLVFIIPVTLAFGGCSQHIRHETLTFFFTGVPKPGQEYVIDDGEKITLAALTREKRRLAHEREPEYFMHGPYGAGACQLCHATEDSGTFRSWGTNENPDDNAPKTKTRKVIGPRIIQPTDQLCLSCHDSFGESAADALQLQLHEPVAKGHCVGCHNPHRAARRFMLLKIDNIELCTECHEKEKLIPSIDHAENPKADCLECHNAHLGKTAQLLKADYGEWDRYIRP